MDNPHFFDRNQELALWDDLLQRPEGKAVVVLGAVGTGKTTLLMQMLQRAQQHPFLRCGHLQYVVSPDESPGMLLKVMMDDAFQAARARIGQLEVAGKRFQQWDGLFARFGMVDHESEDRYTFLNALRFDATKRIFDQFQQRLIFFSNRLDERSRLILVIDPRCDVPMLRGALWQSVLASLPEKIVLLFAAQPDGELATTPAIRALPEIHFIPPAGAGLTPLPQESIEAAVSEKKLAAHLKIYDGSPFAVGAALLLHKAGGVPIEELPATSEPDVVAEAIWKRLHEPPFGPEIDALFRAYAILGIAVPDAIVRSVAELMLDDETFTRLLAHPLVTMLLRSGPTGRAIYHEHLRHHIRQTMRSGKGDWTEEGRHLHRCASLAHYSVLRRNLYPDPLATLRFPKHALFAEGAEAYVNALTYCETAFHTLGFFVAYGNLLEEGLRLTAPGSLAEVDLHYLLGRLRKSQGDGETARNELLRGMEILRTFTDVGRSAKLSLEAGYQFLDAKHYQEAERVVHRAVQEFHDDNNLSGEIESRLLLGDIQYASGHADAGEETLKGVFPLCNQLSPLRNRQRAKAAVCCALGRLYERQRRFNLATEQFYAALELTQYFYDREVEAAIYTDLSELAREEGNWSGAERNQRAALRMHEELGMIEPVAEDYYQLGVLERHLQRFDAARENLRKARELFRQLGNRERVDEIDRILHS